MQRIDLTGRIVGRLKVLSYDGSRDPGIGCMRAFWKCKCECGGTRIVASADLIAKRITKCNTCAANDRKQRQDRSATRAKRKNKEKPPLTTDRRRETALKSRAAMTGDGQKYVLNYEAYRERFTPEQRRYYERLMRGRVGCRMEAEAVDIVMREMPSMLTTLTD
jgi:hypothetical protein